MKLLISTLIVSCCAFVPLQAYDCKIFIPADKGVTYVQTHYNKRDKPTTIIKQTLKDVQTSGEQTVFKIDQVVTDKNGKKPNENSYQFKCIGGVFHVDMKLFLNQPQMEAYRNMDMTIDADDLEMPSNSTAGATLKNGRVTAKINMGVPLTITVEVTDRKVQGEEQVTTPAGTFTAIKLQESVKLKFGIMKMEYCTVTWYSENNGVVKQEVFEDATLAKRTGRSELTAINR